MDLRGIWTEHQDRSSTNRNILIKLKILNLSCNYDETVGWRIPDDSSVMRQHNTIVYMSSPPNVLPIPHTGKTLTEFETKKVYVVGVGGWEVSTSFSKLFVDLRSEIPLHSGSTVFIHR
jgi:hypothetical protein